MKKSRHIPTRSKSNSWKMDKDIQKLLLNVSRISKDSKNLLKISLMNCNTWNKKRTK